jgi:hypothetical protein
VCVNIFQIHTSETIMVGIEATYVKEDAVTGRCCDPVTLVTFVTQVVLRNVSVKLYFHKNPICSKSSQISSRPGDYVFRSCSHIHDVILPVFASGIPNFLNRKTSRPSIDGTSNIIFSRLRSAVPSRLEACQKLDPLESSTVFQYCTV